MGRGLAGGTPRGLEGVRQAGEGLRRGELTVSDAGETGGEVDLVPPLEGSREGGSLGCRRGTRG